MGGFDVRSLGGRGRRRGTIDLISVAAAAGRTTPNVSSRSSKKRAMNGERRIRAHWLKQGETHVDVLLRNAGREGVATDTALVWNGDRGVAGKGIRSQMGNGWQGEKTRGNTGTREVGDGLGGT